MYTELVIISNLPESVLAEIEALLVHMANKAHKEVYSTTRVVPDERDNVQKD